MATLGITLFAAVLLSFMAAGCVWGLLGLLLMKEISSLEFILYTGVFLGLLIMGGVGGPPFGALGIPLAMGLAIGFPLARQWGNQHALARMEQEDIEKYELTVRKKPELPYPYQRLAEIHYKRHHYEAAREWYQRYLELQDEPEIHHRVKRCTDFIERAGQRVRLCSECRQENPAEARYCVACGALLPGWWELVEGFRGREGARHLLTVAVASLVLGVLLGLIPRLSPVFARACGFVAAAAFVYYLYKRVTGSTGRAPSAPGPPRGGPPEKDTRNEAPGG